MNELQKAEQGLIDAFDAYTAAPFDGTSLALVKAFMAKDALRAVLAQPQGGIVNPAVLMALVALAKTGHLGTIELAAQLFGVQACPKCGYIHTHCRCAQPQAEPAFGQWQPIDTAPKNGRAVLLAYKNALGNWRRVRAAWATQSEIDEWGNDAIDDGCEPGWYERSEAHESVDEIVYPVEGEPTHWMPLPPAPDAAQPAPGPAAQEYARQNPFGGPAAVFDAVADSIRAGDPVDKAMRVYGLAWVTKP